MGASLPYGARPHQCNSARLQVRYPEVQVVFADSRRFAEEWTYWFLAAALGDAAESDPQE